jgi:hypothetical protein
MRTAICSWSYAVTSVVTARERGPYWYFQFHEGGKRKKLYLGKTNDPESTLAAKRAEPSGGVDCRRRAYRAATDPVNPAATNIGAQLTAVSKGTVISERQ